MNTRLALLAALLAAPALPAAIPDAVPYQGRIAASGTAYTGTGYFKLAVYQQTPGTPASAALLWTSAAGTTTGALAEPATAVALPVTNGLFALGLGDTAVANMAALPASLAPASGQRAFVRVWFSTTGTAGSFQALAPDTELRAVPFAREAANTASIGGVALANLPQLNAANTFNNVSGLTVQGAAPADNSPAAGVTVPVSGPGSRMEFIPGLAAFRAGSVDGNQWDAGNIGVHSIALGSNTSAPALRSTALGNGATANGIGSLSIGSATTANGWNSMALGFNSTTDGYAASTLGRGLSAASEAEIALGSYNTPYSPSSWYGWSATDRLLVIGNGANNSARSDALVMLKNGNTTANGSWTFTGPISAPNLPNLSNLAQLNAANAFTNVSGLTVKGDGPFLDMNLGNYVAPTGTIVPSGPGCRMEFIPGLGAFRAGSVEGTQWDAAQIGCYSAAFGYNTNASGWACTAMGDGNTASGYASTALGRATRASGTHATAIGAFTTASGYASTALGDNSRATGGSSTALGAATIASGELSTAIGSGTIAPSYAETALGCYNTIYTPNSATGWSAGDRLLVVGNGALSARADAFTVYKNGDTVIAGNAYARSFTPTSDRNAKTDIVAADTAAVLAGVAALPIATWRFKEDTATHLGPMAQDFAAAFHLGNTDKGIATVDADGVALASIQELKKQLDAVKTDSAAKDVRLTAVEVQNAAKDARIASLENELAATKQSLAARLAVLEAKLAK